MKHFLNLKSPFIQIDPASQLNMEPQCPSEGKKVSKTFKFDAGVVKYKGHDVPIRGELLFEDPHEQRDLDNPFNFRLCRLLYSFILDDLIS